MVIANIKGSKRRASRGSSTDTASGSFLVRSAGDAEIFEHFDQAQDQQSWFQQQQRHPDQNTQQFSEWQQTQKEPSRESKDEGLHRFASNLCFKFIP
jgi:hypothetical protein